MIVVDASVLAPALSALAEILGATLLTTDSKLANTPGIRCQVDLVQFPPS